MAIEKKDLDDSLKRYYPEKSSQKVAKEDLEKELIFSKDLLEKVKGKYSPKVERGTSSGRSGKTR